MSTRVTVLYSELADYSLSCLRALEKLDTQIQLIHWPVNPEAPFQFDLSFTTEHHDRNALDTVALAHKVKAFQPDLILCSGWLDKAYLKICRSHFGSIPTILSMDNHWRGDLKQQLARLISPFTLKKTFSGAFVPGELQQKYARQLGFSSEQIQTGFYCADTDRFNSYYDQITEARPEELPKRMLYLGRYVEHKGIFDLWEAFQRFHADYPEWELWCVGTGDQWENRIQADGIKHLGFVQPQDMLPVLKECSAYILPSHFEPWGVSVQELAVAGFPMLLSDAIGSREAFLKGNGKVFEAGNTGQLHAAMTWVAKLSDSELLEMSSISHRLGMSHTPSIWAERLLSFLS